MTTDLLTVSHLNKHYEDFHLADVSFHLPAGYIMGFIGPNGAGKTTTIKAILDMLQPDSGAINLLGQTTVAARKQVRDQLGVVLDGMVYPDSWQSTAVNRFVGPFSLVGMRLILNSYVTILRFLKKPNIVIYQWVPKSSCNWPRL